MNQDEIRKSLADLPLGGWRFYEQIGSTNDAALAWAAQDAPDLSLVCADEQTKGRGRGTRPWLTPPAVALAFSLILRPRPDEVPALQLFSGLGALAVCEAVGKLGLKPEIKWPNDVLSNGRKFCGILVEAVWQDQQVESVVLGIGMNIAPGSVPQQEELNFPATCLETETGHPLDRISLLHGVLQTLLAWRAKLSSDIFIQIWEQQLAFLGQLVEIRAEAGEGRFGRIEGLEKDGSLRLLSPEESRFTVQYGEIHLRPVV